MGGMPKWGAVDLASLISVSSFSASRFTSSIILMISSFRELIIQSSRVSCLGEL